MFLNMPKTSLQKAFEIANKALEVKASPSKV
jgi:hypothetical protein